MKCLMQNRWAGLYSLLVFVVLNSGCKKEDSFSKFVGEWKPVGFLDRSGPKGGLGPTVYTYTLRDGKLVYDLANSDGTGYSDTYTMDYAIRTTLSDQNVLQISEHYTARDQTGKVIRTFAYNTSVSLEEGKDSYGYDSSNKQEVKADEIHISHYTWSGFTYNIGERKLEKIK